MKDISIVVLTYNEEVHIRRCLECVKNISSNIFVVDSFSSDATVDIATSLGAVVRQRKFTSHADQFNWGVDNSPFETTWVMRIDADELVDDILIESILKFVQCDGDGFNGGVFLRKHIFLGKWIRWGGRYPVPMLRIFRRGTAHVEQRWMDEHIVLESGGSKILKGGFEDHNLNPITWFISKHNNYASLEMLDIMLGRLNPEKELDIFGGTGFSIVIKRWFKKNVYLKLPYFFRPALYFCYRYFLQLGFLDGARGFAYHFMQGFWYRALVDLKCIEVERAWSNCTNMGDKISVLESYSGRDLSPYRYSQPDGS